MTDGRILVTGVSGFIASHVAKLLLEDGYQVRGTVRSLEDKSKVDSVWTLVPDAKHPLDLVEADLTKDEGWDKACAGCAAVIHIASPFPNIVATSMVEEQLIGPAKGGTERVLKAAHEAGIRKVVLTSSIAAVFGEADPDPEKSYAEEDWTDPESPTLDIYTKSKVLAEKAAWDFINGLPEGEKMDLVVINPTLVMGPALLECQRTGTSISLMVQILNKSYPAVPRIAFNVCDVRDVARAHIKALHTEAAVGHRHIINSCSMWMKDIAVAIAKEFKPQGYSVPTGQLPYVLCWLAGFFNKGMKSYIIPRLGKSAKVDNKRMVEVLGIEPTDVETTLLDMAYSLVDLGFVRKSKKYRMAGSRAEQPVLNGTKEKEETDVKEEDVNDDTTKELEPEDKEEKPAVAENEKGKEKNDAEEDEKTEADK